MEQYICGVIQAWNNIVPWSKVCGTRGVPGGIWNIAGSAIWTFQDFNHTEIKDKQCYRNCMRTRDENILSGMQGLWTCDKIMNPRPCLYMHRQGHTQACNLALQRTAHFHLPINNRILQWSIYLHNLELSLRVGKGASKRNVGLMAIPRFGLYECAK